MLGLTRSTAAWGRHRAAALQAQSDRLLGRYFSCTLNKRHVSQQVKGPELASSTLIALKSSAPKNLSTLISAWGRFETFRPEKVAAA